MFNQTTIYMKIFQQFKNNLIKFTYTANPKVTYDTFFENLMKTFYLYQY